MGLGQMNKSVQLLILQKIKDDEGFVREEPLIVSNLKMYVEEKHGSEFWGNLASFSEADFLFRCRKIPNVEITTKHYLIFENKRFNILSVENIKGRNIYIEILAKKVEPSSG